MAKSRQERKQEQTKESTASKRRAERWGVRRLKKWWNDFIAQRKATADPAALARFEVQMKRELEIAKASRENKVQSKKETIQKERTAKEFRRNMQYLKDCEIKLKRILEKKDVPTKDEPERNRKIDHHRAEIKRIKKILFGSLVGESNINN